MTITTTFKLFDSVKLKAEIPLSDGGVAPEGTLGVIVEILDEGTAYLVELFGDWVKYDTSEDFIPSDRSDEASFLETIGVEMVHANQLRWVQPAAKTVGRRASLAAALEGLPENLLAEVQDFAEFLKQKQHL